LDYLTMALFQLLMAGEIQREGYVLIATELEKWGDFATAI
jgi:hypothetical protein